MFYTSNILPRGVKLGGIYVLKGLQQTPSLDVAARIFTICFVGFNLI